MTRFLDGPFTASPPAGPAAPPTNLVKRIRCLELALIAPDPPLPAIRDWSWRAGEAHTGLMSHWPDWRDEDTRAVEEAWVRLEWDYYVRGVIADWSWQWPGVAAQGIRLHHPEALDALARAHDADARFARKREAHRRDWVDAALHLGLYELYRRRTSWPDPEALACAVCGREFPPETLSHWMRRYGRPRYCQACIVRAVNGHGTGGVPSQKYVAEAVSDLNAALGFIPSQNLARTIDLSVLGPDRRDRVVAAFVSIPKATVCADVLEVPRGRGRWLAVLEAVGVVSQGWRPARGVLCNAEDGHFCRSLGERSIDDWLSRHGIDHECEPPWPAHAEFNANTAKRADWLIPDGTYIEYAGMMADKEYAVRIAEKVELARRLGVRLLVIAPEDLSNLDRILGAAC